MIRLPSILQVLQHCLSSILVSEVWTNDDINVEISEVKEEILGHALETIKTLSFIVYPAVDGRNKHRLAFIYGLLSDCYSQLEAAKESLPELHSVPAGASTLGLAHIYRVFEQECRRISFIKNLNFKNIADLGGLNLQGFSSEVYAHISDSSLEALAKMVQTLSTYSESVPEGLISWRDVYKYYILSLLTNLESTARIDSKIKSPENFQGFINQLEQSYDCCRMYIRLLAPSDALDIMKRYFNVIIPLYGSYVSIPDNSTWQDCLILLMNFWIRLTEEMQEIGSREILVEDHRFNPECLIIVLKVLTKLVMEDNISPSQGWGTIISYVNHGLIGNFGDEIFIVCRAMVFSGCGFVAISELFSKAVSECSSTTVDSKLQDLPHLYLDVLEPILQNLVSGSHDHCNLYHLLSSLSKLDGDLDELNRIRHVVWERMVKFSENLQLPSHIRVYTMELMQFITGANIKGFSSDLQSNVLPWEGWDEFLNSSEKNKASAIQGLLEQTDTCSRFTNTLVALKSTQLVAAISPSIEITPDDLNNVEAAVSCFFKLCGAASEDPHFDALVAILEEWEGLFIIRDEAASVAASDSENNWNIDDWDEGWESFQDVEPTEKEKKDISLAVHPLHICWMEIFKKFITMSRIRDVLRIIDRSSPKSNGILLDEGDVRSLNKIVLEVDCFLALKMVMLLPYEGVKLESLNAVEEKLKQGGISSTNGRDHEFLLLVLSSGIVSTIITKSSYGTVFSYFCFLVGNFSRQLQETQFSRLTNGGRNECRNSETDLHLFRRILFPCFISELVKADQQILAGFLITKFMHTNASLSLINIAEASLTRYLEKQLQQVQHGEPALDGSSSETLKNSVSSLRGKMGNLIESALSCLSRNVG